MKRVGTEYDIAKNKNETVDGGFEWGPGTIPGPNDRSWVKGDRVLSARLDRMDIHVLLAARVPKHPPIRLTPPAHTHVLTWQIGNDVFSN